MYNMTVKQVREGLKETQTVIIPNGIVEQHGFHLPLSTDIIAPEAVAAKASELTGCFVTPTVSYGFSGGMLAGTINVTPPVVSLMMADIFRSLAVQGFKNMIVLLGHGGGEHVAAIKDAARDVQWMEPAYDGITISVVALWDVSATYKNDFIEGGPHAGRAETSLIRYLRPDLVQMDQVAVDEPITAANAAPAPKQYVIPRIDPRSETAVGVIGKPAEGNPELGKKMVDEAVEGLVAYIKDIESKQ